MLSPETYKRARKNAQLHVQVEMDPINQKVEKDCENFSITGKIVRIFRGYRVCRIGDPVNFNVAIKVSSNYCPSGILWLGFSDLFYNNYMEVYLNGNLPNCNVALYQYKLLETPTEDPVIPSPQRHLWDRPLEIWQRLVFKVSYWLKWRIWLP